LPLRLGHTDQIAVLTVLPEVGHAGARPVECLLLVKLLGGASIVSEAVSGATAITIIGFSRVTPISGIAEEKRGHLLEGMMLSIRRVLSISRPLTAIIWWFLGDGLRHPYLLGCCIFEHADLEELSLRLHESLDFGLRGQNGSL